MKIIGAGLAGCVVARCMADAGHSVQIYEKKNHIGGAIHDYVDENGVTVHSFGPHIFHTQSDRAYDFIRRFGEWDAFAHRVLGQIGDGLCPIPFNFRSIESCFPPERAALFQQKLSELRGFGTAVTIGELKQTDDADLRELAAFIYENVFFHYTLKQWGRTPEELGGDVMNRVPVRISYEDGYFADPYQCMPRDGYTAFLENMLQHDLISVELGTDADKRLELTEDTVIFDGTVQREPVIYTGCLDRLLGFELGALPYRTLDFAFEEVAWPYQPVSVVNYPNVPGFTRISEFGHFYPERSYTRSVIMREFPSEYDRDSASEPYYPIPSQESADLYAAYRKRVSGISELYLAGRLGSYRYMNMDVTILESLDLAERILA